MRNRLATTIVILHVLCHGITAVIPPSTRMNRTEYDVISINNAEPILNDGNEENKGEIRNGGLYEEGLGMKVGYTKSDDDGDSKVGYSFNFGNWQSKIKDASSAISRFSRWFGPIGIAIGSTFHFLGSMVRMAGHAANATMFNKPHSHADNYNLTEDIGFYYATPLIKYAHKSNINNLQKTLTGKLENFRNNPGEPGFPITFQQSTDLFKYAVSELEYFKALKRTTIHACAQRTRNDASRDRNNGLWGRNALGNRNIGLWDRIGMEARRRRAVKCSSLLREYIGLTIDNQMALHNMATILDDAPLKEIKEIGSKFRHLLFEDQNNDRETFRFLYEPYRYPLHRYSVFYFYDNPDVNLLAIGYINSLVRIQASERKLAIVACERDFLQGNCTMLNDYEGPNKVQNIFSSVFVPPGVEMSDIHYSNNGTSENTDGNGTKPEYREKPNPENRAPKYENNAKLGGTGKLDLRYRGPNVYQEVFKPYKVNKNTTNAPIISFRMNAVDTDPGQTVRMCFKVGKSSRCFTRGITQKHDSIDIPDTNEIDSIWIPPGLTVELRNKSDNHTNIFSYSGPQKVENLPSIDIKNSDISEIYIRATNSEIQE